MTTSQDAKDIFDTLQGYFPDATSWHEIFRGIERDQEDLAILTLRLMDEDETTCAPETMRVVKDRTEWAMEYMQDDDPRSMGWVGQDGRP